MAECDELRISRLLAFLLTVPRRICRTGFALKGMGELHKLRISVLYNTNRSQLSSWNFVKY